MNDYDSWKCGWDDSQPQHMCKHCEEREQTLDEASNLLHEVLHQLYSIKSPLDADCLEHSLKELAYLLRLPVNLKDLQIERKRNRTPAYLVEWVINNNNYLKHL